MAGRFGCHRGGIRSLLDLIDRYEEAVRYDLLTMGLRLDWVGTEDLDWADFKAFIAGLPSTSALVQTIRPDEMWDLHAHLLAAIADRLAVLDWHFVTSKLPKRKRTPPAPKPIQRPGVAQPEVNVIGGKGDGLTLEQMDAWIAERVPRAQPAGGG